MVQSDDRTPPTRVRLTGLQEAQLPDLVQVDAACAAMYYDLGFDGAEVPTRSAADFAALTREHNIYVAEADHVPVGFVAWRDESPGVAYLGDVSVHPDYQRFGIGSRLLSKVLEEARALKLRHIVVRCWEKATWAMSFYRRHGFGPIEAASPAKVLAWRDERAEARPLTRPGEIVLWTDIDTASLADPGLPEDDAEPASTE